MPDGETKMGRPTIFSPEVAEEICLRLSDGETLISICRDERMPAKTTIWRWLQNKEYEDFRNSYTQARIDQAQHWADEIVEISDDGARDVTIDPETGQERLNHDHIQRSRLRVDTRKFLMAKIAPRLYGDKTSVELTGKDGGPIETQDAGDDRTLARRVAFLLAKGLNAEA